MEAPRSFSLDGTWRFRRDPNQVGEMLPADLVRTENDECQYYSPTYDDADWSEIPVPACWQAAGHDYNGVAWYRRRFQAPPLSDGQVARLRFWGVDYFADVWLNGFYLGTHEGYFAPFELDATRWIRQGDNLLAARVDSPNDIFVKSVEEHERKALVKGALQDWDVNNLDLNPGGIWNAVELVISGPAYVKNVRFMTTRLDGAEAVCQIAIRSTFTEPRTVAVNLTLTPWNFEGQGLALSTEAYLVPGVNVLSVRLNIPDPHLWWTWDMGRPHLYTLRIDVASPEGILDTYRLRTGLRTIERRAGWQTYLNGKRFFWRGANYLSDQLLSNVTRATYETDVRLMREANMNMVRPFCVVEKAEFYDVCDEQGVLVYQDFPMQWRMTNTSEFIRRAAIQAGEMIDFLFNHPSIVIWCFGSEPGIRNFTKLGMLLRSVGETTDPTRITQQGNETMGRWPTVKEYARYGWLTDMHYYMGWYSYHDRPAGQHFGMKGTTVYNLNKVPREFFEVVTEYGAQALPDLACMGEILPDPKAWPPDWKTLKHHCMQPELQLSHIPEPHTMEELIRSSQEYQAFLLKYHTEYYRKLKYKPCNGALMFTFNDCWPAVTWSVVDYRRHAKSGYDELKRSFSPVHVLLDWWDPLEIPTGEPWEMRILVVNDLHKAFPGAEVRWTIIGTDGRTVSGGKAATDIAADSPAVPVGTVAWTPAEEGSFVVNLELWHGRDRLSTNAYRVVAQRARGA